MCLICSRQLPRQMWTQTPLQPPSPSAHPPPPDLYVVDSLVNFVVRVDADNSTQVPLSLPTSSLLSLSLILLERRRCDAATTGYDAANSNKAYLTANCRFTPTISGDWTIQATYLGDTLFASSQTSTPAALTVNGIPTQTFATSVGTYTPSSAKLSPSISV